MNYVVELISKSSPQLRSTVLDFQNEWGNTPLHWAALNGHLEVVKALSAAGADMKVKNKAGHDAAYEAERNSKDAVVEFLLQQDQGLEGRADDTLEFGSSNDDKEAEVPNGAPELVAQTKNMTL